MGVKLLMVAASVFALMQLWSCNGCLEDERVALLQIQASFNISGFLYDSEEKKANCCDWRRIECDASTGRVTHLDLSYARDWDLGDWYLNFSLFHPLKQLTFLDLSYNNLKGSINLEELTSLKNLEELKLSGNKKISEIVASIDFIAQTNLSTVYLNNMTANGMPLLLKSLRLFSYLKILYLQYNNLTSSSFRHESQSFKSLETLYLDGSVVDDDFFLSLDALSSLKSLSFHDGYGLYTLQGLCNLNLNYLQSLVLTNNNLSGRVHPCLSNFTSLQHLDLSDNSLQGSLLSSSLDKLTHLQYLDLSGNNFSNALPWWLANLTSLQLLDLSYNSLEGSLYSSSLSLLTHLVSVDLRDNKLRGEFPHELLENNTRLKYLFLSNNSLTGTIILPTHSHMNLSTLDISSNCFSGQVPTKFGSYFPNLFSLDMSHNRLNGSFPPSIGNLSSLDYLDMSDNELSGQISTNFGSYFPNLGHLDMSHNELNGSLPPSISNLIFLSVLYFNNNHFSGEIPTGWGSMEFLRILDISRNNISGNIPRFWTALSLREVYMSSNMLNGSFLQAFSLCFPLTTLDLSNNLLKENLSRWNGDFSRLSFLLLGQNMLEGQIPSELCSLRRLSFIDLSNNKLSGPILSCLMNHSNWLRDRGEYSNPYYAKTLPARPQRPLEITTKNIFLLYKGRILTLYSGVDLSCNNLSGPIPTKFGNLNQIKMLNLSHNSLIGHIPATFSNLYQIESLDLSYNKLQGNIPPQLTQLPFISSFSVAHNNLSGSTLEMIKQFATFNNDSYEGNPFLCGEPLSRSCSLKPPSTMLNAPPSNEEESGFIDMRFFYVTFVVTYTIILSGIAAILYINPYWRRAWFYFLERKMEDCYYFAVYDCPRFFKFKA